MTRFLKGVMAGVVSVAVGTVVIGFCAIIALRFMPAPKGKLPIGRHLVKLAQTPIGLGVAIALFLFGFVGEMRRN